MHAFLALGLVLAATPATPSAAATELARGVHLIRGELAPGRQPDGNSVLFRAPEGLIVVDTARRREHTRKLLDFAAAVGLTAKAIINTHWHLDHVGGNVLFREEFPGVRVYASSALAGAMTGFLAHFRADLENAIPKYADKPELLEQFKGDLALIDAGPKLAPDEVVTASGPRTIAGLPLALNLETHAVTAGDVWVLDPASGDLVTLPVPFLDTACLERWQASLAHLAKPTSRSWCPGTASR